MSRGSTKLLSLPPAVLAPASKPSEPLPVIARVLSRGDNESINYNAAPEPIGPQFETEDRPISGRLTAIIITCVTCVTAISSLLNGLVAIAIPTMARDLGLASGLILWCDCNPAHMQESDGSSANRRHRPSSIYFLTAGCTLLLFGSLADVVGSRTMYLIGCGLQSIITLACGLVRTSTQLIIFRALAGLAISCCLPSAVSIITNTFPLGGRRNIAFGAMGGGQSVGFVLGMVFGGVFTGTIGWRWGFHAAAVINTLVFFTALFGLPKRAAHVADAGDAASGGVMSWRRQLRSNIDWVGNLIASTSLAMLAYVLAYVPPPELIMLRN